MPDSLLFKFPDPFGKTSQKSCITITLVIADNFKKWLKQQKQFHQDQIAQSTFEGKSGQTLTVYSSKGVPEQVLCGIAQPMHYLDVASAYKHVQGQFSQDFLKNHVFTLNSETNDENATLACIGWGLGAYQFDRYTTQKSQATPVLLWPKNADQKKVLANIQSICLIRNLINTAPNDLGTDELAEAAQAVAKNFKAKTKLIKDDDLLKKNFPMIYTVGKASPRRPQLFEMNWGKKNDPKVTIVGKGIIYDTGGLNLKPGQFMRDMKKDMGGAAHALGLAWMIMALNLPVQLRVLLPIAENAVSGNSYRPGDVLDSRKGLTVEIGDTDAEGRLVVADALTFATEEETPDLLVDFCTLTGAARVAVGYDIPAFFTNKDELIEPLRSSSLTNQDPVWPLPLWMGYDKEMDSTIADVTNDGSGRAGAIHGALFLNRFIEGNPDWVHLDCYAWEQNGKAGRPKGGADTGMRAMFHYIKARYAA